MASCEQTIDSLNDQGNSDSEDRCVNLENFKEAKECEKIIKNLSVTCVKLNTRELSYERFRFIVDQYQEQPHLLDSHLQSFIDDLLGYVISKTSSPGLIRESLIYLYLLTKTRGYKVIVRHLPHEVTDLEPVLTLLKDQDSSDIPCWEARYMLILWLSIICMVPFDMVCFDGNLDEGGDSVLPIMDRIIEAAKKYLEVVDKSRDGAAYLLSRFLTRPDVVRQRLPEIMHWACSVIQTHVNSAESTQTTLLLGVMYTLALLYKHGKREDLLQFGPDILTSLTNGNFQTHPNTLLRKCSVKLIQRVGLIFLKPRSAPWRYERGKRSLLLSLDETSSNDQHNMCNTELEAGDDDDMVPEQIELVIEHLLNGLRDGETIVRWSSAKGIGRITGRLPKELADDIVETTLNLFHKTESDKAWHGGCLVLAELGRRGLLLPERLGQVVPAVLKALLYDERRGTYSVGANVRDAACYVCWAFARAYDADQIKPYINDIANALVIVSLFDREVNVRRAASAAFQENVGRQGSFPHGIDILTKADYYSVSRRNHCYLDLSVFVADFKEYTESVIKHIVDLKSQHWDSCIRELSGFSLAKLTPKAPEYMSHIVIPQLLPLTTDMDSVIRHGSIVAVANIIHALYVICVSRERSLSDFVGNEILNEIVSIPKTLHKEKRFRGHGGDLLRKAVCFLIDKLCQSGKLLVSQTDVDLFQEFLDDCLCQKEMDVQKHAVSAISSLALQYYRKEDGTVETVIRDCLLKKYVNHLENSLSPIRVGFCMALGSLPHFMLEGKFSDILSCISKVHNVRDAAWVDSRSAAILALNRIIGTLGITEREEDGVSSENVNSIYDMLFVSMDDYTTDSRGDIGRVVREAAMTCLTQLTSLIVKNKPSLLTSSLVERTVCLMLQQTCEKIDRTREHACLSLISLLYHDPEVPFIPNEHQLLRLFTKKKCDQTNWASANETFPVVTPILQYPVYAYNVLLGLTVSVGGISESVVNHSQSAFHRYLETFGDDMAQITRLADNAIKILDTYAKNDRVTLPMLRMLDYLLSQSVFTTFISTAEYDYAEAILIRCKQESIRCSNLQKLLTLVDVYCSMFIFPSVRSATLLQLMILLGHSYPRIRKAAAEKFYEALVMNGDVLESENLEEVMTTLSDTVWDQSISILRPIRDSLCDLLHVKPPRKLTKTPSETSTNT